MEHKIEELYVLVDKIKNTTDINDAIEVSDEFLEVAQCFSDSQSSKDIEEAMSLANEVSVYVEKLKSSIVQKMKASNKMNKHNPYKS